MSIIRFCCLTASTNGYWNCHTAWSSPHPSQTCLKGKDRSFGYLACDPTHSPNLSSFHYPEPLSSQAPRILPESRPCTCNLAAEMTRLTCVLPHTSAQVFSLWSTTAFSHYCGSSLLPSKLSPAILIVIPRPNLVYLEEKRGFIS